MTGNATTPATTARSVRAATEYLAVHELASGLYLVDNGEQGDNHEQYRVDVHAPACTCHDWEYRSDELGDDGCKHIRRCRMERGEIDMTPLLEMSLDLDPILLEAIDTPTPTSESDTTVVTDGGLPDHLTEMPTLTGDTVIHCQTCGGEGDAVETVDHHEECTGAGGDA